MLIRIRGGRKGIEEYLRTGRKKDRIQSREELDYRLILHGDLDVTSQVLQIVPGKGEKYLHITLAFKEDLIDEKALKEIIEDFRKFTFTAYKDDEYNFYAEAHLPRIQSTIDESRGLPVDRKPHIHIVIPKVNLLSGKALNPFGLVRRCSNYIDAFQEKTNKTYHLESPKSNRRVSFTNREQIIDRYKGDGFKGPGIELKSAALKLLIQHDVTDFKHFAAILSEIGETRIRNANTEDAYVNVKSYGDSKGINLKEAVFRKSFLELPTERKIEILTKQFPAELGKPESKAHYDLLLDEWEQITAYEVKYLNSGNKQQWKSYSSADENGKKAIIRDLDERFYKKWSGHHSDLTASDLLFLGKEMELKDNSLSEVLYNQDDSVVAALLRKALEQEKVNRQYQIYLTDCEPYIRYDVLLQRLNATHGVQSKRVILVSDVKNQTRLHCAGKTLDAFSFLTQILYLPVEEAMRILQDERDRNIQNEIRSDRGKKPDFDLWKQFSEDRKKFFSYYRKMKAEFWSENSKEWQKLQTTYHDQKRRIYETESHFPRRKQNLSLIKMRTVLAEKELIQKKRDFKRKMTIDREKYTEYSVWLQAQALNGNFEALKELRKGYCSSIYDDESEKIPRIMNSKGNQTYNTEFIEHSTEWTYTVDRFGTVFYSLNKTQAIIDKPQKVEFVQTTDETIEVGLRLAIKKFGVNLSVQGSEDFKKRVARITKDLKLNVTFEEKWMNNIKSSPEIQR